MKAASDYISGYISGGEDRSTTQKDFKDPRKDVNFVIA
jgi:hypothetical protein